MTDKFKILDSVTTEKSSQWIDNANQRVKDESWLDLSFKIGLAILRELRKRGMTQAELATKMGVSPQYINKVVKGKENLGLDTISNLGKALSINLLSIVAAFEASIQGPGVVTVGQFKMSYKSHSNPGYIMKPKMMQEIEPLVSEPYETISYFEQNSEAFCEATAA